MEMPAGSTPRPLQVTLFLPLDKGCAGHREVLPCKLRGETKEENFPSPMLELSIREFVDSRQQRKNFTGTRDCTSLQRQLMVRPRSADCAGPERPPSMSALYLHFFCYFVYLTKSIDTILIYNILRRESTSTRSLIYPRKRTTRGIEEPSVSTDGATRRLAQASPVQANSRLHFRIQPFQRPLSRFGADWRWTKVSVPAIGLVGRHAILPHE